jgi:hypothetical protein
VLVVFVEQIESYDAVMPLQHGNAIAPKELDSAVEEVALSRCVRKPDAASGWISQP